MFVRVEVCFSRIKDIAAAQQKWRLPKEGVISVPSNNMKGKNCDLDRWRTKMRAPFESVFSQQTKRTRYRGVAKNQFSAFMEALCFNLKKLVVLKVPPMTLT